MYNDDWGPHFHNNSNLNGDWGDMNHPGDHGDMVNPGDWGDMHGDW